MYTSWRKAIRKKISLPYKTHCDLLPHICDDMPPDFQLLKRVVSFISGLSKSHNIITSLCYKLALDGSTSNLAKSMSVICNTFLVRRNNICNMNTNGFSYNSKGENAIKASIIRDLLVCKYSSKYFNQQFILSNNEIDFMLNELCVGWIF